MDSFLATLAAWMPQQRWYAAKGRAPLLRDVASWDLPSDEDGTVVRTYLVSDDAASPAVLYQVPVVIRRGEPVDGSSTHAIGRPEDGVVLYDAPHDPAYTGALLNLILTGGTAQGSGATASGAPAHGAPASPEDRVAVVLSGEQSNTSIIFRSETGAPLICKVFRQVHPGLNPDIELQTALAEDGSPHVPAAIGSVEGTWPAEDETVTGSLAFAQEFLPGAEDAWRVALRAAADGEDFATAAGALGAATARVHLELAALFPTAAAAAASTGIVDGWRRRLDTAIAEVPSIAAQRAEIEAAYARAAEGGWPDLQRVHGDYHLGQVIQVPDRGWILLDFEGEPLRPMNERTAPDLALRDVAGMLRSFDYVAGSLRLEGPERSPESIAAWVGSARRAFVDGYAAATGVDLGAHSALLSALEVDKAVYEAIYEARNRPTWLPIPLEAVARLTAVA